MERMSTPKQINLARPQHLAISELKDVIYDNLTMHREQLTQLTKLLNVVIYDLDRYPHAPAHCIEQAGITLGIAQYLLEDFSDNIRYELGQLDEVQA